jgi:SHS2 domain-containing protein
MKYELLDHTADLGIQVFARDPGDLFTWAALAMFDQIVDTDITGGNRKLSVTVTGADWADLMVNWLRELLYLWTVKELLVASIDIFSLEKSKLSAKIMTCPFDTDLHPIKNEIKAVTYHQINVVHGTKGWEARVIFDI